VGGIVGAVVAVLLLGGGGYAYYEFVHKRKRAQVSDEREQPLLAPEERVSTPVVPAELDFGDDDAAPEAEAGGVAEGWGECHACKNPCKKGWPRCPSCKTKLSLLTAGAAPQEGEEVDAGASALDDTAPCWKCQAPVRSSWPRCPGCKAQNPKPETEAGSPEEAGAATSPLEAGAEAGAASAALDPAFISECWRCKAPVKSSWSVCPGCKAPTNKPEGEEGAAGGATDADDDSLVAAERAAAGFAVECENCKAPVKPEWPRCPGCKHPVKKAEDQAEAGGGAAAAAASES